MNIASVEIVQNIQLLRDAEVVHVSEGLLDEPGPLFGDSAHLVLPVRSHDLKLHVPGTGEGAPGALDDQGHVTVTVSDLKPDIACLDGVFTIVYTAYLGFMQDHNWLTYPMTSPGGELISRDWRQQGKQQESQRRGLFK